MMAIRLAEAGGEVDRGAARSRPVLRALPRPAAAAAGARAGSGRPAGAAHRRARPHRRGLRGLPARGAVGFPGHRAGARHDQGRAAADRHHHLEPHARDPRRAEAPLPLSLGRLSRRGARARHPQGPRAGARRRQLSKEIVAFVQAIRKEELFKAPGVAETLDWASALVELDAVALDPALVSDTLGVLLKYQDDIQKMQGSKAKAVLDGSAAKGGREMTNERRTPGDRGGGADLSRRALRGRHGEARARLPSDERADRRSSAASSPSCRATSGSRR